MVWAAAIGLGISALSAYSSHRNQKKQIEQQNAYNQQNYQDSLQYREEVKEYNKKVAGYKYQASILATNSALQAYSDLSEGHQAIIREHRIKQSEDKQRISKKALEAKGAARAMERSGRVAALVEMDLERQKADFFRQNEMTMASREDQYRREIKSLDAQLDTRLNQAQDLWNLGLQIEDSPTGVVQQPTPIAAPSPWTPALQVAAAGLNTWTSMKMRSQGVTTANNYQTNPYNIEF